MHRLPLDAIRPTIGTYLFRKKSQAANNIFLDTDLFFSFSSLFCVFSATNQRV